MWSCYQFWFFHIFDAVRFLCRQLQHNVTLTAISFVVIIGAAAVAAVHDWSVHKRIIDFNCCMLYFVRAVLVCHSFCNSKTIKKNCISFVCCSIYSFSCENLKVQIEQKGQSEKTIKWRMVMCWQFFVHYLPRDFSMKIINIPKLNSICGYSGKE